MAIAIIRRLVIILALPILLFTFLIGWVQYFVGSEPQSLKKEAAKNVSVEKQTELAGDEGIEMERIEEGIDTYYRDKYSTNLALVNNLIQQNLH